MARVLESTTRATSSKHNEYGKGSEKGQEKGKKGKGKRQGKHEKPAPNSSFQGYCRSCGKWGHKASECWQGYAQAVEFFCEFSQQLLFKRSMMRTNQDGSSA